MKSLCVGLAAVGVVCLLSKPGCATDPARELHVGLLQDQISVSADSLSHSIDSITYTNPRFDSLFHLLGAVALRYEWPEAVMRTGIWGQPGPLGVPKPNFDNCFVILFDSPSSRESAFDSLRNEIQVAYVFRPETETSLRSEEVDDEFFHDQWGLSNNLGWDISATDAWYRFTTGSGSVTVGIIDGGTEASHEDFQMPGGGSRVLADPERDPSDPNHGTNVAGIVGAVTDNGIGLAGIDWNCRVVSLYGGDVSHRARRTFDVVDLWNAKVVNHSYGQSSINDLSSKAMTYAYNNDVVSVASMPNYPDADPYDTPSFHPGVIAVGSIQKNGQIAPSSGQGSQIDFVAPGGYSQNQLDWKIRLLYPGSEEYGWSTGTSFAAPHVTGVVSLLRGKFPELSNDDVYQILIRSATPPPHLPLDPPHTWDPVYGYGLVNAARALEHLSDGKSVNHGSAENLDQYSVSNLQARGLWIPALSTGEYVCKVYELRKDVSFAKRYYPGSSNGVWARGSSSLGFSNDDPNLGLYSSEFVPGTISPEGATMRTYVYEVWEARSGVPRISFITS